MDQLDPSVHTDTSQNIDAALSSDISPGSSRKRSRENESPSQRQKREKAAARQRRKRQRDRSSSGIAIMNFPPSDELQHQQDHHQQQQEPQQQQQHHTPPQAPQPEFSGETVTPEEAARRDRVRASARERQRKHRQLVKQRKMRELGMDMGNELMPGMEVHYRVTPEGQYPQVLPHELHHPHAINHHEPPFPHGQPLGGQTFASTLLLSFSCAPLLKQNLLRSLVMTNEELASLEPIIAEAWDRWDHQRRLHYAEQAAKAGGPGMSGPSPFAPVDLEHAGHPFVTNDPSQPAPNDFRARFHRPLVAPSPFRTFTTDTQTSATMSTPPSAGSGPSDSIDPHLSGPVVTSES